VLLANVCGRDCPLCDLTAVGWLRGASAEHRDSKAGVCTFPRASALKFAKRKMSAAHHSKPVKAWLAERTNCIEVIYLPSYAPDLNPDERLNADMKHAIGAKAAARTKSKLKTAAEEHMTMIGRSPDRVRAYFKDPRVKYAA
jgi:DDE superfamily endonuclease